MSLPKLALCPDGLAFAVRYLVMCSSVTAGQFQQETKQQYSPTGSDLLPPSRSTFRPQLPQHETSSARPLREITNRSKQLIKEVYESVPWGMEDVPIILLTIGIQGVRLTTSSATATCCREYRPGCDRSQYCVRMRESPAIWVSGY